MYKKYSFLLTFLSAAVASNQVWTRAELFTQTAAFMRQGYMVSKQKNNQVWDKEWLILLQLLNFSYHPLRR